MQSGQLHWKRKTSSCNAKHTTALLSTIFATRFCAKRNTGKNRTQDFERMTSQSFRFLLLFHRLGRYGHCLLPLLPALHSNDDFQNPSASVSTTFSTDKRIPRRNPSPLLHLRIIPTTNSRHTHRFPKSRLLRLRSAKIPVKDVICTWALYTNTKKPREWKLLLHSNSYFLFTSGGMKTFR